MNKKVYNDIKSGRCDNSIRFNDLWNLILDLGFEFKRQNGSHNIFYNADINVILNIQKDGAKAKGYEVKQLRYIINKYNL